ncbi:MAG: hypothetical protein GXX90_06220, partial [Microbacteriaceae bacterium]|nr:hypothetical protein [Microbacteriaceae bacterium]
MSAAADSTATAARGEVLAEQNEPAGAVGWRRADLWIALGLLVLTLAIALVTIVRAPEYSRIDEYTHADYAYRIWHGELPAAGDQLGQEMLADWSCRGDKKSRPPECGSYEATIPEEFIYEAYQYNFFHPPVFYGAVAVVAGTISDTAGLSFVTAARMASAGVAALGAAAVFLAIRSWRVRRVPAAAIGLLTIANPMVAHAAATVNPDSIAMLVGAGAVWVLGRIYVHGRVPIVAAGGIMLLAAGSKVIIAMVLVAVCIVIGIDGARRWFRGERGMGGRMVALAAVCAAVLIAVYVGWSAFQAGRGDPDWENPMTGLSTAGFGAFWPPAMAVATSITNMFGIGGDYWT